MFGHHLALGVPMPICVLILEEREPIQSSSTVQFTSESSAPSTFSAEIEYVDSSGLVTVQEQGPGSYTIQSSGGAGTDRIRFRSHSLGQNIRVTY